MHMIGLVIRPQKIPQIEFRLLWTYFRNSVGFLCPLGDLFAYELSFLCRNKSNYVPIKHRNRETIIQQF